MLYLADMTNPSDSLRHYFLSGRIWIESDKGPFVGNGRIVLLKKIVEYGSISQAAKSMKMSYRQAWHLVESMNQKAMVPLVISYTGGKGGGGAKVTEEGEKVIREFESMEEAFQEFLKSRTDQLGI